MRAFINQISFKLEKKRNLPNPSLPMMAPEKPLKSVVKYFKNDSTNFVAKSLIIIQKLIKKT